MMEYDDVESDLSKSVLFDCTLLSKKDLKLNIKIVLCNYLFLGNRNKKPKDKIQSSSWEDTVFSL